MSATTNKYDIGQIWEYQSRSGEEVSHIYIVRIDDHERLGKLYHIYIDGVQVKNPYIERGVQNIIPHIPVEERTLDESLTRLIEITEVLPDPSNGYNVWKQAFDSGEGGVFNIPVKQIIQYIEDATNNKM